MGVVLYEMLTGVLPFDGPTLPSVILAILSSPMADIRTIRQDIPAALADIINRLLTREQTGRYTSADELSAALRGVSGVTVKDQPGADGSV